MITAACRLRLTSPHQLTPLWGEETACVTTTWHRPCSRRHHLSAIRHSPRPTTRAALSPRLTQTRRQVRHLLIWVFIQRLTVPSKPKSHRLWASSKTATTSVCEGELISGFETYLVSEIINGKGAGNFLPGHNPLILQTFASTLKHNRMYNSEKSYWQSPILWIFLFLLSIFYSAVLLLLTKLKITFSNWNKIR